LRPSFSNIKIESVASFVKLQLFLILFDLIIMEFKVFILKFLENFHMGAQVDRSLFFAKFKKIWVDTFCNLLLNFGVENKIDTGPFNDGIFEILGVIIVVMVGMIFFAVRTTFVGFLHVFECKLSRLSDVFYGPFDFRRREQ